MITLFFAELRRYPTYLVLLAVVLSLVASGLLFPFWIRLLKVRKIGQQVRADGPQGHLVKQGTPTMGGVLILFVVVGVYLSPGQARPLGDHRRSAAMLVLRACSASSTTTRRCSRSARSG